MFTQRTLVQWRRESLEALRDKYKVPPEGINIDTLKYVELHDRILRLTGELIDQNILRRNA